MSRHPFVVRQTTRRTSCEPGPFHLSIRIVIAPTTRSQTRNAALATDRALYYAQRASAKWTFAKQRRHLSVNISDGSNCVGFPIQKECRTLHFWDSVDGF
jgi:hypothetical protein